MIGRAHLRSSLLCATLAVVVAAAVFAAAPAASGTPAAVPGPTGPLDHMLCYTATTVTSTVVRGFRPPATVGLANQFNPDGFQARVRTFAVHCNPVEKTLPTGEIFKIQNPSWHLGCWSIVPDQTAKTFTVRVENQFGTAVLNTLAPNRLCLPSLKSEKSPPTFLPPGANEVRPDHFTCYPVAYPADGPRFQPPPAVRLRDQFTPAGAAFTAKIGLPTQLCLPTAKTVPGAPPTPVKNPREHLLCFAVTGTNPAALPRTVFDRNQFGTGAVKVTAPRQQLCLPSLKTIVTG